MGIAGILGASRVLGLDRIAGFTGFVTWFQERMGEIVRHVVDALRLAECLHRAIVAVLPEEILVLCHIVCKITKKERHRQAFMI